MKLNDNIINCNCKKHIYQAVDENSAEVDSDSDEAGSAEEAGSEEAGADEADSDKTASDVEPDSDADSDVNSVEEFSPETSPAAAVSVVSVAVASPWFFSTVAWHTIAWHTIAWLTVARAIHRHVFRVVVGNFFRINIDVSVQRLLWAVASRVPVVELIEQAHLAKVALKDLPVAFDALRDLVTRACCLCSPFTVLAVLAALDGALLNADKARDLDFWRQVNVAFFRCIAIAIYRSFFIGWFLVVARFFSVSWLFIDVAISRFRYCLFVATIITRCG